MKLNPSTPALNHYLGAVWLMHRWLGLRARAWRLGNIGIARQADAHARERKQRAIELRAALGGAR